MTEDFKRKVYQDAIKFYGTYNQHNVAMEECGELIQAIAKFMRSEKPADVLNARNHIREEIADVLIMIEQLKIMHSITNKEIEQEIEFKVTRQKARMEDDR